jgi:uncharacterized protein with GYD domain
MRAMTSVCAAGNVTSTTMRGFDEREMDQLLKQAA